MEIVSIKEIWIPVLLIKKNYKIGLLSNHIHNAVSTATECINIQKYEKAKEYLHY